MPDHNAIEGLRADLDYDQLIEQASPALRLYIRRLEQENARLRQEMLELRQTASRRQRAAEAQERRSETAPVQVATVRHPDDVMVITITSQGLAKRTPLNEYSTQHRGGVGIFDIQAGREDPVRQLLVTRTNASLLILTDRGRGFRLAVETVPLTEIRGRGSDLPARLMLTQDESLAAILALDDERDRQAHVLIATSNGWVRSLHRNYVGPRLQPGTLLFDPRRSGGHPVAMTLSDGESDVVLALRSGNGIRFSESLIRRDGVRGIQVHPGDAVAGIASVREEGEILLVSADGKGTRREVSGFTANKTPGGQGKALLKTDALAGIAAVSEGEDALCITGFAKIIRFAVKEIPSKSGVVQGVQLMDCRGDTLAAVAVVGPPEERDSAAALAMAGSPAGSDGRKEA